MSSNDEKNGKPQVEVKSSMEILSELFSTFDAEPPVIVKKEKDENKKHKKSKKKHKHKDKKHKKKSKKRKKEVKETKTSGSSSSSDDDDAIDLSDILIKSEIGGSQLFTETLQKIINIKAERLLSTEIKKEIKTETPDDNNHHKKVRSKSPEKDTENAKSSKSKIKIKLKDLKHSSILSTVTNDNERKCHKRKKHKDDKYDEERPLKKCMSRSKSKERDRSVFRTESKSKASKDSSTYRDRSPRQSKTDEHYDKYDKYEKDRTRDSDYRSKYRDDKSDLRYKLKDDYSRHKDDYSRHKDDGRKHTNSFYKDYTEERRFRDRYKEHDRDRSSRNFESDCPIDKKKLLEIARKNAIQMMKSGNLPGALTLGPQAQEKVIAAIRCGGKTVAELTDFCKTLSKKEELGELSSVSEDSDSDGELKLHHPFLIKDRPLTINIKNSVPLPTKTNQERASELRIQFPVSSGQQHRKTESEWVPVSPKKTEAAAAAAAAPASKPAPLPVAAPNHIPTTAAPLAIEAPPPPQPIPVTPPAQPVTVPAAVNAPPGPQVFPVAVPTSEQDLAGIVSQRLAAMRKLQENPNDSQAIVEMYNAQKDMNMWAESKQPIGQFTGTTGVQILSQAELASGYQAWARKDQLQTAAPVSGGMGMHLLQKMGWRPGEGLGKEKSGALEPLLLEVKLDKKGIVAKEECKKKTAIRIPKQTVKTLQGKHPVSLLGEFASKRKLGAPEYVLDFECGPDHMKNFLYKVRLNGVEYKPNVASGNKKEAKAMAATLCLKSLGLLA